MSTPLVSTIALFLTTLAPTVQASWRMGAEVLLSARMDPLIAPGAVSGHVHDVVGGSNFKNTYDYDELRRSECSSVEVQDDLSNYWAPAVYYQHTDGKYELVPSSYAIYYLHRGDEPNRDIKQFPAGFRMIAGSAVKNSLGDASEDKAISFKCLSYQEPSIPETREFPKRHCPDGIRVQVLFPSCWNGIDPTSANYKTHVSYPQNGVAEGGICPSSHPVRLMTLFYEHIIESGKFQYREGAFSFAHGDNVGWSNHGDFQNGWDASPNSVLAQAIRECNPQEGANLSSCGVLMRSVNTEKAKTCRPKTYLPLEDIGIYGGLSQLPGDNPIWGGGRAKNLRGGANIPPWASAFSTLAPGWNYHGCIDEGNIYVNAMTGDKRLDGNNYPGACVDYCESKGFTMAGLEAGNECYCANELTNGGRMDRVDAGLCSWTCPGSAYELCGGGRKISLYTKSDRSRGGTSAGSYPPVGSRFTQVYTSDGSAPPPLPGNGGTNPPPPGNGGTNPPPPGNGGTSPPPPGNGGTTPNPSPGSGSSPNPSPPSQPVHPQCTLGIRRKKRSLAERKIDNAKYASHLQYSHRRHMYPGAHH